MSRNGSIAAAIATFLIAGGAVVAGEVGVHRGPHLGGGACLHGLELHASATGRVLAVVVGRPTGGPLHHLGDQVLGQVTTEVGRARVRLATRVAIVELLAIGLILVGAAILAEDPSWIWPLVIAGPMFAVAFLYDLRSQSRDIVPEVVGSVALAAVAAMGTLAGGGSGALALGAWLILSARVFSSIPHVRAQVRRVHEREVAHMPGLVGDLAAVITALVAVWLERSLVLGAASILGLVVVQRITLARPPRPVKVLGARQMVLGFSVVGATAIGAWWL